MIEELTESDFLSILFAAEEIDGIVIGGQALNLWAASLLNDDDYEALGPFTSKDLDFWGTKEAAEELAQNLGGRLMFPEKWDHTPSEAAVVVKFDGQEHQIDFLRVVCGLDTKSFRSRAQEIEVEEITATVLHPLDVLKSRAAGVNILRRTDPGAIRQLRAAPIVVRRYIEALLDRGEIKEAQSAIGELIRIGYDNYMDPLFAQYGFDPLSEAQLLTHRAEWHPNFAEFQIAKACQAGSDKRARRIQESIRRNNHEPGKV